MVVIIEVVRKTKNASWNNAKKIKKNRIGSLRRSAGL